MFKHILLILSVLFTCNILHAASLVPTKALPVEKVLVLSAISITGSAASGTVTLNTNPANSDTLTLNGTAITFVTAAPGAGEVQIGADVATTFASLLAFVQASADAQIAKCTYTQGTGNVLKVAFKNLGTAGNSFTLAKSSTHISVSGAVLAGGTASNTSSTINANGLSLVGVQLSAAFTSTTMTFSASVDGITWQPVYSTTGGSSLSYTVAQGHYVAIDPVPFYGIKYLRIVTGSDEIATRSLTASLKGI